MANLTDLARPTRADMFKQIDELGLKPGSPTPAAARTKSPSEKRKNITALRRNPNESDADYAKRASDAVSKDDAADAADDE